jgi:hypothetical protein
MRQIIVLEIIRLYEGAEQNFFPLQLKYHRIELFGRVVKTGKEEVKYSGRYAAGDITTL